MGLLLILLPMALAALLRFWEIASIPRGWHHDEALMGVMASEVLRGVQRPLFFTAYLGQEPLYIYLSAGMMWLTGSSDILPLRLVSALAGVATVGVTYLLGREMFGRRVGWVAAWLLAASFWQVMLGRMGYRTITQPLLEGLTVYLLWRAARKGGGKLWGAAGGSLGATFYTYLASRSFPIVFVLFAIWWVATRSRPSKAVVRRLILFLALAAATAAPLALFFLTHPGTFAPRLQQVSILRPGQGQTTLTLFLRALGDAASIFTWQGFPYPYFNLPNRPVFVGAVAILFYVGALVVLVRAWRGEPASAMVVAWMVGMSPPILLSEDGAKYILRAMGLVPALYMVPALGLMALWGWLERRWPRRKVVILSLVVLILASDVALTFRDYFFLWSDSFDTLSLGGDDVVAQARYLEGNPMPEGDVFVASEHYPHPVLAHLAPNAYPSLRWFDGRQSFVYSPGKDNLYLVPFSSLPQNLDDLIAPSYLVSSSYYSNQVPRLLVYHLTATQVIGEMDRLLTNPRNRPLNVRLGGEVELLAYRLDSKVRAGDVLELTLIWRVLDSAQGKDYVFFSHLLDHKGRMWGQGDVNGYPSAEWRPGDVVVGRYDLRVSPQASPGRYLVDVGIYDRATLTRLKTEKGDDSVVLGAVKVTSVQAVDPAHISQAIGMGLGEDIRLLGFDLSPRGMEVGEAKVTLYWQTRRQLGRDYTVFLHLLDENGNIAAQTDSMPGEGGFPTSFWEAGEIVVDSYFLKLPPQLPPGRYRLIAGMYLLDTGERLPTSGGDYIVLTTLER